MKLHHTMAFNRLCECFHHSIVMKTDPVSVHSMNSDWVNKILVTGLQDIFRATSKPGGVVGPQPFHIDFSTDI